MFRVVWLQTALDELATIWMEADSPTRQAITAAAHEIDKELESDPHHAGESHNEGERVFFVPPVGVEFDLDDGRSLVRVFHVWDIRRRR